ncbi:MAG: DUF2784 domain-containing protein [Thermoanaerobaculia bacterium]
MLYRVLAEVVLFLHLAFVVFVVLGGFLASRWPRLVWVHVPVAVWGVGIELANGVCPLTPLENWLRTRAGGSGYQGGFVEHYLLATLYPDGLTRTTQFVLAAIVVVANAIAYAIFFRRGR